MSHNPSRHTDTRPDAPRSAALSVPDDHAAIHAASDDLLKAVSDLGYPTASQFAIRLAFEEAILNALRHGHKLRPSEPVEVCWQADGRSVVMSVTDKGPGFNPDNVPDPTEPDRIELPSGRGLLLMRAYMSAVEYNDTGNAVRMTYNRPTS
jgi:serine/threonine-protein kinase RsbW